MSYSHRKDNRTDKEFADYIKLTTQRENLWSEILCKEFGLLYNCNVEYNHFADGGEGDVIKGKIDATPDKIFKIKDKNIIIEIKTFNQIINSIKFFTFKKSSLQNCYDKKGYIVVPNYKWWSLIQKDTCKYLIDNFEAKIYYRFSPNDTAIRIYADDIRKMREAKKLQILSWKSKESKFLIEKNKNKLFR